MYTNHYVNAYLAGSMEKRKDNGARWRSGIEPSLTAMQIIPLNPLKLEKGILEKYGVTAISLRDVKKHLHMYKCISDEIVEFDLDIILNRTDIVVCYLDQAALDSSGTVSELTVAKLLGIPVYCVVGVPIKKLPLWTIGTITKRFSNFKELLEHLSKHPPKKTGFLFRFIRKLIFKTMLKSRFI